MVRDLFHSSTAFSSTGRTAVMTLNGALSMFMTSGKTFIKALHLFNRALNIVGGLVRMFIRSVKTVDQALKVIIGPLNMFNGAMHLFNGPLHLFMTALLVFHKARNIFNGSMTTVDRGAHPATARSAPDRPASAGPCRSGRGPPRKEERIRGPPGKAWSASPGAHLSRFGTPEHQVWTAQRPAGPKTAGRLT